MLGRRARALACGLALAGAAWSLTSPPASTASPTEIRTRASAPRDGRIVYDNLQTGQIETANPDGSGVVPVTDLQDAVAVHPRWLPDESRIVFTVIPFAGQPRIFTIRPDGSGMRQVTTDGPGFANFTPTATPDGRRILYSRCQPDPPGGCAIFSVRLDGTDRRQLTSFHDRADFWPEVDGGGRMVTFSRFGYRGITSQVWLMRINGSGERAVTAPRLEAFVPRFFRDGRLLVTMSSNHLGSRIASVRRDGTGVRMLTHARAPHNSVFGTPSPSRRWILFDDDRAYPDLSGQDHFVMRADGSGKRRIQRGFFIASDWGSAPLQSARSAPLARAEAGQPAAVRSLLHRGLVRSGAGRWSSALGLDRVAD
jgi:Tol biopolymer transport system component